MSNSTHVGTIAIPDTGKIITVAYQTDDSGGEVILTVGRIGHDEPDATVELGATHVGGLYRFLENAVAGIMRDRGVEADPDPLPFIIVASEDDDEDQDDEDG